jgi:hypothetical protein
MFSKLSHPKNGPPEQVKNILLEIYAEDWKSFIRSSLGKIAIFVWTVITLIISAIINSYLP